MPPLKIAITGLFRTGKDTLGDAITVALLTHFAPTLVARLKFADELKREIAEMSFNYVQPKGDITVRELPQGGDKPPYNAVYVRPGAYRDWLDVMKLERDINGLAWQWWGEWRRQHNGEDYWVQHPLFQAKYAEACRDGKHIIITDMRHYVEQRWCREQGFYLVRVEGPCRSNDRRDPNHESERFIQSLDVDYVVENTGSYEALDNQAEIVVANAHQVSEHISQLKSGQPVSAPTTGD